MNPYYYYSSNNNHGMYTTNPYETNRCYPNPYWNDNMYRESCKCKLSARNQLTGKVIDIERGAVNTRVVIDVGCGHRITSIITMASLDDLNIEIGKTVTAVVKSSDVILMV